MRNLTTLTLVVIGVLWFTTLTYLIAAQFWFLGWVYVPFYALCVPYFLLARAVIARKMPANVTLLILLICVMFTPLVNQVLPIVVSCLRGYPVAICWDPEHCHKFDHK